MPVAHCVSTTTGVILTVDEGFCALVQRAQHDLIGLSYKAITASEDLQKSREMLHGLSDKAAPTHLRKRYVRPDGSMVEADLLVSKFDNEGRLVSTLSWAGDTSPVASPSALWTAALQVKHLYELRIAELGRELFSDHVGLILVHTYLAEAEGRLAGVSDIANVVGLPRNTAGRWVKILDERGLINMLDDKGEFIQLTHDGAEKLERLFSATLRPATPVARSRSLTSG